MLAAPAILIAAFQVRQAAKQNQLAAEQAARTAEQQEDALRPVVIATIEPITEVFQFAEFHVRNVGMGPAYGVKLDFVEKPDLSGYGSERPFWEASFARNGISVLGPGQDLKTTADLAIDRAKEKDLIDYGVVRITYRSVTGKSFVDEFVLDMGTLKGTSRVAVGSIHDLNKNLEGIQKILQKHFK